MRLVAILTLIQAGLLILNGYLAVAKQRRLSNWATIFHFFYMNYLFFTALYSLGESIACSLAHCNHTGKMRQKKLLWHKSCAKKLRVVLI